MKTSEDRLRYRSHFLTLAQGRIIPILQRLFWHKFWSDLDSSNDIFEVINVDDIKLVIQQNKFNFVIFVRVLCLNIVSLTRNHEPLSQIQSSHLLNCVRLLTRFLPFLYEMADYESNIEQALFWNQSFDLKLENLIVNNDILDQQEILGFHLITALLDCLFYAGFTVESASSTTQANAQSNAQSDTSSAPVTCKRLQIWEPGIGSSGKFRPPNLVFESNRSEILKLIVTLCSTQLYQTTANLVNHGCKFLTVLVTCIPKVEILTLTYSLINLVCRSARSHPDNALSYNNSQVSEMRYMYVTHAIQLLTIMIIYPLPCQDQLVFLQFLPAEAKSYNFPRTYLGKLLKNDELLYIGGSFIKLLKQVMFNSKQGDDYKFTLGRNNSQPSLWASKVTALIWELMQCNSNFKSLVGNKYSSELMVVLLYTITNYHSSPQHRNLVRISSYLLLYLSSDLTILEPLFEPINTSFYECLPNQFKVSPTPVTTRDFVVVQLCQLLLNSSSNLSELTTVTLTEILYNLITISSKDEGNYTEDPKRKLFNRNPHGGLSYAASSSITQLIVKLSNKKFLIEKAYHANLLALVLRAIVTASIKYSSPSRMLLFSILKNEKIYNQIWNTIYSFLSEYFNGDTLLNRTEEEDPIGDQEPVHLLSKIQSNCSAESIISANEQYDTSSNNSNTNISVVDMEPKIDTIVEEIELSMRPKPLTGMSGRAKEKMPKESPLRRTWGGNDSLRIILTILIPHLKLILEDIWNREQLSVDSYELIVRIGNTDFTGIFEESRKQINYDFLPETPLASLKFSWSHLSLGWYISLIYNEIYHSVEYYNSFSGNNNKIMKNLNDSMASVSKFTNSWKNFLLSSNETDVSSEIPPEVVEWVSKSIVSHNIWEGTTIVLFKVEIVSNEGFFNFSKMVQAVPGTPTMHSDRPASVARRISDFRSNNNSRGSITSLNSGQIIIEEKEGFGKPVPRNSVTSLHSLNTLNRSRSNTPRNSISI